MSFPPDVEFMRELESDFVRERMNGLRDLSKYKIFYSGVGRSSAIFLGINPAGDAENFLSASQSYEEWGHDFLEFEFNSNYKLAKGAVRFLRQLVGKLPTEKTDDIVRQIPVGNVCFFRSQDPKYLKDTDYAECAPYVRRILERVDPIVAVAVGKEAFQQLEKILGAAVLIQKNAGRDVTTANGKNRTTLYRSYKVTGDVSRLRLIVQLGHLSKFGLGRDQDWALAYTNLEADLTEVGLRPFATN
jgi:hypothetical protein